MARPRATLSAHASTVSQISQLQKPQGNYLKRLREWIGDSQGGSKPEAFAHPEAWVWRAQDHRGERTESDFVAMAAPTVERDVFTQAVIYPLVALYHALWGRTHMRKQDVLDLESGIVEYNEEKLDRIGMVISTVLASVLPVVAVLGLFFVHSLLKRIYIMIGITAAFAGLLALLSDGKGRRIEIFAATATWVSSMLFEARLMLTGARFAAVEVVFIGSSALSS
jgi:hypothetical protein